jgi:PEP-CTERM motif
MATKPFRLCLLLGLVFLLSQPATATVLAPTSTVGGKTVAEWGAEWWKWAFSFPATSSPLEDPTGERAFLGDVGGPVFFAGAGSLTQTFTLPEGQYLLIPVLSAIFYPESSLGETLADAEAFVEQFHSGTTELHASLDGVPIEDLFSYWLLSPVFSLTIPPDGLGPEGTFPETLVGGYWLMISPLAPGVHTLVVGGSVASIFDFETETTAHITATPEPASLLLAGLGLFALSAAKAALPRRP